MKVSYIVTVYNKALYLPLVVQGLATQEGDFEREFIFVDDGSTDDSAKVLRQVKETLPGRVEIIEQLNSGPAVASNKGFEASTGELIKFVDGDGYKASDYFDVPKNEWSTKGISEAFGKAYRACSQ